MCGDHFIALSYYFRYLNSEANARRALRDLLQSRTKARIMFKLLFQV